MLAGVQKELLEVLTHLSPEEFQTTVIFMYRGKEEHMQLLPPHVRILCPELDRNYYFGSTPSLILQRLKRGKYREAASLLIRRLLGLGYSHANTDLSAVPELNEFYDCAVCYHLHSPLLVRYAVEKTRAARKICWVHNDCSPIGFQPEKLRKYLDQYDLFVSVSRKTGEDFLRHCPWLKNRHRVVHNLMDPTEIRNKAEETIPADPYFQEKRLRLLTIGRMDRQKGFDLAVRTAELLRNHRLDFAWYLMGDGILLENIQGMIQELHLQDRVFCMGGRINPYPYIKNCNIYIQPSRHEGHCLTIQEACSLARPVICFDFSGASEQIRNGETGLIVSPSEPEHLAAAILRLAADRPAREQFSRTLQEEWNRPRNWQEIIDCFSEERPQN